MLAALALCSCLTLTPSVGLGVANGSCFGFDRALER